MSRMNPLAATCWTCLLLFAFLCDPVLSKGGRGGSRGSSRGTSSRSSAAGGYRGAGAYGGGTRSRIRAAGRSSPVRVASAAAAGAAVALTADRWYASAYRRGNSDGSGEELDYFNRTNYFDALMSASAPRGAPRGALLAPLVAVVVASFLPTSEIFLDFLE